MTHQAGYEAVRNPQSAPGPCPHGVPMRMECALCERKGERWSSPKCWACGEVFDDVRRPRNYEEERLHWYIAHGTVLHATGGDDD